MLIVHRGLNREIILTANYGVLFVFSADNGGGLPAWAVAAIAITGAIFGLIGALAAIVAMIAAVYKCIMWIRKHLRKGM